ncbi:MAG: hypothetical protein AAF125_10080 [Chloroflexota bacterium]
MLGLFLLFSGLTSVTNGQPFGVMMGLGGFYLLARQFEESRNNRLREQQAEREYEQYRRSGDSGVYDFANVHDEVDRKPTTNADRVHSHALEAVQRAGLDASQMPLLPVDIGLFGHKGDDKPRLYRTRAVPMDVDYVQPFVQLRLPRRASGKITFEIIDDRGETLFIRTEDYVLNKGRNLVVPSRRLPVHDALDMDEGNWSLRISAGDTVIAEHYVRWVEAADDFVGEQIREDGEISNELRAAMAESRLEKMSLDDLLAFQGPDPQTQSSSSSKA